MCFGSVSQVCFGISVSNFMCMSFVAVGRSLMIVSYVAFKMAAFWIWTMFNCNPPIAHCHPLLWGGGILVDHWSTNSSYKSVALVTLIMHVFLLHCSVRNDENKAIHSLTHWFLGIWMWFFFLLIGNFRSYDNALGWVPKDLTDDKPT